MMQAVVNVVTGNNQRQVTDFEIGVLSSPIAMLGILNVVAGIFLLCTFWTVYYAGFFLAVMAITLGWVQHAHSRTPMAVRQNGCCIGARGAFSSLTTGNIVVFICGIIGTIIGIIGVILHERWWRWVALVGALACVVITLTSAAGWQKCAALNTLMLQDADYNTANYGQPAVASQPAVVAQPYQQPAPAYGQPQQAQPYGQPQQAQPYGQPQQQGVYGNQQQGAYGNQGYPPPPPPQEKQQPYGNSQYQ